MLFFFFFFFALVLEQHVFMESCKMARSFGLIIPGIIHAIYDH